jgi:hypothetical protein
MFNMPTLWNCVYYVGKETATYILLWSEKRTLHKTVTKNSDTNYMNAPADIIIILQDFIIYRLF